MTHYSFLYARRSSDEDDRQTLSLDAQEKECRAFASARGLEIHQLIRESHSAREPGRPLFDAMMEEIRSRRQAGMNVLVICHKPDRLLRNVSDWASINKLMDANVEFLFVSGSFPNNAQGKMAFGMNVLVAKYYVDNLSEEVRKGLRQKITRGEWPGWAPLGYLNVSDKLAAQRITLDPIRSPLVRRAFEYYATGEYSLARLAVKLHEEGLAGKRLGKRLSKTYLQERVLTNPFYCGLMHYNGQLHPGSHEPLITFELFDAVQQIMHGLSRPRKISQELRYRGVFRCSHCGSAVVGEVKKGKYRYYRCIRKRGPCPAGYFREEVLDHQLEAVVARTIVIRPQVKAALITTAEALDQRQAQHDERAPALEQQLNELQRKSMALLDVRIAGHITDTEYAAKRGELVVEQARVRQSLQRLEHSPVSAVAAVEWVASTCNRVETVFSQGRDEEIREYLRIVGSNYKLGVQGIDFEPVEPFVAAAQAHNRPQWCGTEDHVQKIIAAVQAIQRPAE